MAWHDGLGAQAGNHILGYVVVTVGGAVLLVVRTIFTNQRKVALLECRLAQFEERQVRSEAKIDALIARLLT